MGRPRTPPDLGDILRRNLVRLRQQRGWDQQQLAVRIRGWTRSTVAAVETGRREVSVEELLVLAETFGASLDDFLLVDDRERVSLLGEVVTRELVENLVRKACGRPGTVGVSLQLLWGVQANPPETREAEQRAARALTTRLRRNIDPSTVVAAARRLWDGRSLTEERDRRLAKMPGAGEQRVRRGHVTRELLDELQGDLSQRKRTIRRGRGKGLK